MVESKRFPLGKADREGISPDVLSVLDGVRIEIKKLRLSLRPEGRFLWYQTGRVTIKDVAVKGNYADYDEHNFLSGLGYTSREGTIQNFGPGILYIALAKSPSSVSPNEAEIQANGTLEWSTDDGYELLRVYIRSDDALTQYQIIAG